MAASASRLLRASCWALRAWILFCVLAFLFITYARPSRWFREGKSFDEARPKVALFYEGPGTEDGLYKGKRLAFMSGLWTTQIIVQWGATWGAAVGTALLCYLLSSQPPEQRRKLEVPLPVWAKRVLFYQLPPRQLWWWWCGGMSVLDMVLVLAYLGLNLIWTYETCMRTITIANRDIAAGKEPMPANQYIFSEVGVSTGFATVPNLLLLFYPLPRSNFLQWLLNADFNVLVRYHRWMGHGTTYMILLHSVLYYILWIWQGQFAYQTFMWQEYDVNNLAGSIATLFCVIMWLCSLEVVRRRLFAVFYRVHVAGFILVMLFSLIHYKYLVYYIMPGLLLYMLDVALRLSQMAFNKGTPARVEVAADGVVTTMHLDFDKNTKISAGQTVWLRVSSMGAGTIAHPLTVASSREGDASGAPMVLHMKQYGRWSKALTSSAHSGQPVELRVDGPYGPGSARWAPFKTLVLLGGGVGVTPLLAILHEVQQLREAAADTKQGAGLPQRVHLVWVARYKSEFTIMDQALLNATSGPDAWLTIDLYYTGNEGDVYSKEHITSMSGNVPTQALAAKDVETPIRPNKLFMGASFGYLYWALAVTISLLGSFAAMIPAPWYDTSGTTTGSPRYFWLIGIIQLVCFPVGAMLPILLMTLPLYYWRRQVNAAEAASGAAAAAGGKGQAVAWQPVQLLPGSNKVGSPDDVTLELKAGRPNLHAELADIVHMAHMPQGKDAAAALPVEPEKQIGVFAAGPEAFVFSALDACCQVNARQGSTYLDFHQASFFL